MAERITCTACSTRIVFAKTAKGKKQALNFGPDPAGLVAAYCDEFGQWHAKHAPAGEPVIAPWKRHMPHQATCGQTAEPPKRPAEYVAPFETGEPWRGPAQADWDSAWQ